MSVPEKVDALVIGAGQAGVPLSRELAAADQVGDHRADDRHRVDTRVVVIAMILDREHRLPGGALGIPAAGERGGDVEQPEHPAERPDRPHALLLDEERERVDRRPREPERLPESAERAEVGEQRRQALDARRSTVAVVARTALALSAGLGWAGSRLGRGWGGEPCGA